MSRKTDSGSLSLPGAIIIAGALIAVALIWIYKPANNGRPSTANSDNNTPNTASTGIPPVTAADHLLGNPNAPIKLIEYSDLSCPYCKEFNPTMEQVMDTYGPGGKVAWIYRHFPLYQPVDGVIPHPNSLIQAEALECAAQLGGNSGFFAFEKKWFSVFPDDGAGRGATIDREVIRKTAEDIGLDAVSFNECVSSGRFKSRIEQSFADSLKAGVTGTPLTIMVTPSGNQIPLIGVQPFTTLKRAIDTLITTIPATTTPTL